MLNQGQVGPSGDLSLSVVRAPRTIVPPKELSLSEIVKYGTPQPGLAREVNTWRWKNLPNLQRGARRVVAAKAMGISTLFGALSLVIVRADGSIVDLGLCGLRVVTTAGVNFIVDAFQNSTELENMKFHGIGTGSTAEAAGDTALVTELTTQLNPNSTRATGTTTEGASANIYRTVGTNTVDAAVALREHGIFDQAATGGGTLLDRTVFALINLADGDSLQSTFDLTLSAGS